MAFLFDTDAISEVLKRRPLPAYVAWLRTIPRAEQFTSAVVVGELFKGAYRSADSPRHLRNIETRVLPAVTVLPYDVEVARVYGALQAQLEEDGRALADADLQIGATAVHHDLELVTGNLRHFRRITGLRLCTVLDDARLAGVLDREPGRRGAGCASRAAAGGGCRIRLGLSVRRHPAAAGDGDPVGGARRADPRRRPAPLRARRRPTAVSVRRR